MTNESSAPPVGRPLAGRLATLAGFRRIVKFWSQGTLYAWYAMWLGVLAYLWLAFTASEVEDGFEPLWLVKLVSDPAFRSGFTGFGWLVAIAAVAFFVIGVLLFVRGRARDARRLPETFAAYRARGFMTKGYITKTGYRGGLFLDPAFGNKYHVYAAVDLAADQAAVASRLDYCRRHLDGALELPGGKKVGAWNAEVGGEAKKRLDSEGFVLYPASVLFDDAPTGIWLGLTFMKWLKPSVVIPNEAGTEATCYPFKVPAWLRWRTSPEVSVPAAKAA